MSPSKRRQQQPPSVLKKTPNLSNGVLSPFNPRRTFIWWSGLAILLGATLLYKWVPNLHLGAFGSPGNIDPLPFQVVELSGKGKGLVATRDIESGELILRERPLFMVPPETHVSPSSLIQYSVEHLNPEARASFYNLSYVNFPADLEPELYPEEVALAIFQTNGVAAGEDVGIFPTMARINHGCSSAFNVVYTYRPDEGVLVVYALKGIKKGKELLTTYTDTKRPREERREFLSMHYGFRCGCDVCALSGDLSSASDERLKRMAELYEQFKAWGHGQLDGRAATEIAQQIWNTGEEEGYISERGRLAADAAWVAAAHSDGMACREWAQLASKWFVIELGGDSRLVSETREIIARPETHHAWGTRAKMQVARPIGM